MNQSGAKRRYIQTQLDNRSAFQRDRDRIIYASSYRRLAGVTQVVSALEGHVFHNRLTHTMKVAQVARRIAEKLQNEIPEGCTVPLDPDVVEGAAHAHDIGHPPFGHIAEELLQQLMSPICGNDPFEGNDNCFRIVTKLANRSEKHLGLDLTQRTLDAILKYPWQVGDVAERKWGAFGEETEDFKFARGDRVNDRSPSLEAKVMDWADDITYAVHDAEDLFRAGLIPGDRFRADKDYLAEFAEWVQNRWTANGISTYSYDDIHEALSEVFALLAFERPYEGTREDRVRLRMFTSYLISRYLNKNTSLVEVDGSWTIERTPEALLEVKVLKELTWRYVIERPALAGQQHGQKAVISNLFSTFMNASDISNKLVDEKLLPVRAAEALAQLRDSGQVSDKDRARVVCDSICLLTEDEALRLHARLTGASLGSVLDAIV